MRNEAERQRDGRGRKPDPPRLLPEMVIDDRRRRADREPDAEPDRLAFHEEERVAVAVARKCARTEKHHDADHEHREHSDEQDVSALAMHQSALAFFAFGAGLTGMASFCPTFNLCGSSM